jgi:hypothetical protein
LKITGAASPRDLRNAARASPASLDGLRVENHAPPGSRSRVDDPEGLARTDPVPQRERGTEMASCVIHGDFDHREPPLPGQRLCTAGVPACAGRQAHAGGPAPCRSYYQAVRRIKVGGGGEPAAAPRVVLINLSLLPMRCPLCAHRESKRQRLTGWQSFIFNPMGIVGFVPGAILLPPSPPEASS